MERFISRKFLLALAGIVYGILSHQTELVYTSIIAYIGAEGLADTAERYKAPRTPSGVVSEDFDEFDTSQIVTGVGRVKTFDESE